jgi:copper(I)-binding protein
MSPMLNRNTVAPALALALALCACGERKPDGISVAGPWVRMPPVKGQPGAIYFTVVGGAEGTKLTGLSSPLASRVELHESMAGGGMSAMKRLKDVDFDYQGKIRFEPGGRHAMVFGLNSAVKPGSKLPLTFAFNAAPPVTVEAEVRDAAGESHASH